MFRLTCASAMGLAAVIVLAQAAAQAGASFDQGLKHYNRGRYGHAVLYFTLAAEEEPDRAVVHYYLADALVRSGHPEQALEEYGLCYKLAPGGRLARYCRQALARFDQPCPAGPRSLTAGGGVAAWEGSGEIGTEDQNELVERAKSHIKQEVIYEKSKHEIMGESFAAGALQQAESESRRIREEAARELEEAMTPPVTAVGRCLKPLPLEPELLRARVEEIKRRAAERIENAKKTGQAKADKFKQWSKERQEALDQVASNLETQLEQPAGGGGVKLQPVGTDLYTRYYGRLKASSQLPEARPAAVRIIEHPAGLYAGEQTLGPADDAIEPGVQKIVRGKVLH